MTVPSVWVKVCGLRRDVDVAAAVSAGADAVGLVLTDRSPRAVSPDQAAALAKVARDEAAAAGRSVVVVGVFSGESADVILARAKLSGVDAVQLHGGESEAVRRQLEAAGLRRTIRALWPSQMPPGDEAPPGNAQSPSAVRFPDTSAIAGTGVTPSQGGGPWAVLLDSRTPSRAGGTGQPLAPELAAAWSAYLAARGLHVILAGGLRPDNVADALAAARPWGVDVSSGVEVPGRPGVKDSAAIRAFVEAVRAWEDAANEART